MSFILERKCYLIMNDLSLSDKHAIVRSYLYDKMSIRQIRNFFYPDRSYHTIRKVLLNNPQTRSLLNSRARNRTQVDDETIFTTYQKEHSLRRTAKQLGISTTTVHNHVLKYQKTHDVKPLIKETGDN